MRILLVCRQLANHRTGNSLVCQDRGRGDKSGTLSIKLCQVNTNTSHCDGTLLTFEIFKFNLGPGEDQHLDRDQISETINK